MMPAMRSSDASDPPSDDFEPAQLMIGPDGGVDGPVPETKEIRPPPRLCEQGPCVNYHRFAVQLDAEGPKAASVEPGGKLVGKAPPAPFHVEHHHYCYPTVGIEFELGGLPVTQCNRWDPKDAQSISLVEIRRTKWKESAAGKQYEADLAAWQAERDAADAEIDSSDVAGELAAWITMHMRDGDELEIRKLGAPNGADPVMTLDAPMARNLYAGLIPQGSYRAWITRNHTNVSSKDFEVPHVDG